MAAVFNEGLPYWKILAMAKSWSISAPCNDHDAFIAQGLKVAMVCISWFFFSFFLCKLNILLQFFSILRIWVKDFVCKLSVLLWTIALHVGGCLCNLLFAWKSRNKGKKRRCCFVEKRIKKTTFEPPSFSLSLLPSCHFFYNNFE
jgi:hypothetical protein